MSRKEPPRNSGSGQREPDGQVPADSPEQAAAAESFLPEMEESLESELSRVRAELETARDLMLRSRAELDNYQKRVPRQIDEERKFASLPLLRDLLPVLDNVQRAIEAAEKSNDAPSLLNGFKMVGEQLDRLLQRHHCLVIEALHRTFDPHLHEALMQQPSGEFPANTVLQVVRPGFQLYDRVVRPSQVIVSSAAPEAQ